MSRVEGTENAAAQSAIAAVVGPTRLLYVDGGRTDAYIETGSPSRPFKTIQAAVDLAETMSPEYTSPVVVHIFPQSGSFYAEDVVIKKSGLTLESDGGGAWGGTTIRRVIFTNATVASLATFKANGGYADPAANYGDLVADATTPSFVSFKNLNFGDPDAGSTQEPRILVMGVGAGSTLGDFEVNFQHCVNNGPGYYRLANYIGFRQCYLWGTSTTFNVTNFSVRGCDIVGGTGAYVGDYDSGVDQPSDPSNNGLVGIGSVFWNHVILNGEAAIAGGGGSDGFSKCRINRTGDALILNETSTAILDSIFVNGNVTVGGDASFTINDVHITGTMTLADAGAGAACTMNAGDLMGVKTDAGLRLTRNASTI